MEILAPAGGADTIMPAVRAGADAVYLGLKELSARASAKNFSVDELREAVTYCRGRGVRVYLACNTLVTDEELRRALEVVRSACSVPVDALIVQDVGLVSLIQKAAPGMRLHASTQMSVHNLEGVRLLHEMGFKRVVLSRELSRDEIAEIAAESPIELEVFVHGALCMSVSGQCYFSAMLGGRSGNRGACAQPCRLAFEVKGGTGHDLSLKDCSLVPYLRELDAMGVASAKIEGRMKRPEYTAVAVAACRQSLDTGTVEPELMKLSESVFSRSGFTDGYYKGSLGRSMFGIRSKEDVLSATNKTFAQVHTMYKDERRSIPIDARMQVTHDSPALLTVNDGVNRAEVKGAVPEPALRVPLSAEKCHACLQKTGGTPFCLRSFEAEVEGGLSLSAAAMNDLRRQALDKLLSLRSQRESVPFAMPELPPTHTRPKKTPKSVRARFTHGNIPDDFLDCELVYVPIDLTDSQYNSMLDRGFALAVEIPRGMFGIEKKIYDRLKHISGLGINEVLASNIGAVALARKLGMDIHGGFGLNITNTASVEWAERMGLMDIEVSIELTLDRIAALGGRIPLGIVSRGRLPLMLTRNYPGGVVPEKDEILCLRDRKGMEFPLQRYGACTEMLNSVPLDLADRKKELVGIDFEVLRFSVENSVETGESLALFNSEKCCKGPYTRGLYYRGVK